MDKKHHDIDKLIRQAAEDSVPEFSEAAWVKMEQLLDKPKDRRTPALWWIPILMISVGIGMAWYFGKHESKDHPTVNIQDTKNLIAGETTSALPKTDAAIANIKGGTIKKDSTINNKPEDIKTGFNAIESKNIAAKTYLRRQYKNYNDSQPISKLHTQEIKKNNNSFPEKTLIKNLAEQNKNNTTHIDDNVTNATSNSSFITIIKDSTHSSRKVTSRAITPSLEEKDTLGPQTTVPALLPLPKKNTTTKTKNEKLLSKLFVTIAGGPATDGASFRFSGSRITFKSGLGIGVQANEQLAFATGFYIHNKIYEAGPDDYTTKGYYWANAKINYIDATCKVFEIPIVLNYTFPAQKKLIPYANIGLLSLIMKSEYYDYYYTYNQQPRNAHYTYTGNKHLFAYLLLSGGIALPLGKKISVFTEPGLAIPILGVGEGKVTLTSVQVLSGIKYFPLKK